MTHTRHTYIHHITITIHSFPYTSSTPFGRPAGSDSSRLWWIDMLVSNIVLGENMIKLVVYVNSRAKCLYSRIKKVSCMNSNSYRAPKLEFLINVLVCFKQVVLLKSLPPSLFLNLLSGVNKHYYASRAHRICHNHLKYMRMSQPERS